MSISPPPTVKSRGFAVTLVVLIFLTASAFRVELFGLPSPHQTDDKVLTNASKEVMAKVKHLTSRTYSHPPRKMSSTKNNIYFLHIGKTGGTSMDLLMYEILGNETIYEFRRTKNRRNGDQAPMKRRYIGHKHFDWTFIEMYQKENFGYDESEFANHTDVITILRHPVSRGVSQFYFSKRLPFAKKNNATFLRQTLGQYLCNPGLWRQPIQDGISGVLWLAGTEIKTKTNAYLRSNKTAWCLVAAERLDQTLWFALFEDFERSLKLLQLTLDLAVIPKMPKLNKAIGKNPSPSEEEVGMMKKYFPSDLWLYEYAQRLFEARWDYFVNGNEYVHPELPPLPDFSVIDPLNDFDNC
jgi:hypothetical protein